MCPSASRKRKRPERAEHQQEQARQHLRLNKAQLAGHIWQTPASNKHDLAKMLIRLFISTITILALGATKAC
jgi:hypothetical protein